VAFSPDGKILASGSADKTILLWDLAKHEPAAPPLAAHTAAINSLAFSPDSHTLVSGGDDGAVILWPIQPATWLHPVQPLSWLDRACYRAGRKLTQAEWQQYLGDKPYEQLCQVLPADAGMGATPSPFP
jgi:WD40 repeat protein